MVGLYWIAEAPALADMRRTALGSTSRFVGGSCRCAALDHPSRLRLWRPGLVGPYFGLHPAAAGGLFCVKVLEMVGREAEARWSEKYA